MPLSFTVSFTVLMPLSETRRALARIAVRGPVSSSAASRSRSRPLTPRTTNLLRKHNGKLHVCVGQGRLGCLRLFSREHGFLYRKSLSFFLGCVIILPHTPGTKLPPSLSFSFSLLLIIITTCLKVQTNLFGSPKLFKAFSNEESRARQPFMFFKEEKYVQKRENPFSTTTLPFLSRT